jgi:broad specificity phosphatase PhoE
VWSTETKARETLRCAIPGSVDVTQDSGFDEVRRYEPFDDHYLARRLAWVTGNLDARHAGWETPQEAATRFEDAVLRHHCSDRPLIIATHGMIMTAWLVHCRRLPGSQDPGEFWRALSFPDLVHVDN